MPSLELFRANLFKFLEFDNYISHNGVTDGCKNRFI